MYQTLQGEGSLPLRVFLTPNYEDIHIDTVHGGLKTVGEENGGSVVLLPYRAQGLEKVSIYMITGFHVDYNFGLIVSCEHGGTRFG